jgi:predicted nuclease of predicted toxin-antitoxin system
VTNLFIELYLDEDVSVLVADLVRARGFTALTTREAGQLHASDTEQLAYAVSRHKTFLTHNRADFEALGPDLLRYRTVPLRHYYRGAPYAL